MKGIVGDVGEMNIPLKPNAKLVKQRPYRLNPRYKENIKAELDRMLDADIIEPIEESKWISPWFLKTRISVKVCICVDLKKLNNTCLHDPFLTPFIDEVLESIGG